MEPVLLPTVSAVQPSAFSAWTISTSVPSMLSLERVTSFERAGHPPPETAGLQLLSIKTTAKILHSEKKKILTFFVFGDIMSLLIKLFLYQALFRVAPYLEQVLSEQL